MTAAPPDLSGAPGTLRLVLLYGSHAHGTAGPTSDEDWRGVYQLPTDAYLGLGRPRETWERKPDIVLWELGQFARMLLAGNPNIVGMLWAPDECVDLRNGPVQDLWAMRERFITRRMVSAYMGWVHTELRVGDALTGKRASHLIRLLWELDGALREGAIPVRLPDARRRTVVAVKRGDLSVATALGITREEVRRVQALADATNLPEPPTADVERVVIRSRRTA